MKVKVSNNRPLSFEFQGVTPFSPLDIAGAQNWLNIPSDINSLTAAGFFKTFTDQLDSSSVAFDVGDEDFSFGGWIRYQSATPVTEGFIGKFIAGKRAYLLYRASGDNTIHCGISSDGNTANTFIDTGIVGSTTVFKFCVVVYDSVADLLKISIDNGAFITAPHAGGAYVDPTPHPFQMGTIGNTDHFGGAIDSPFFYTKALSAAEVSALYNSGNGISYDDLSVAQKISLVSWWDMNELSGTRSDSHSSNDLTASGTGPTSGPSALNGQVVDLAEIGEYVYQSLDSSPGLNHAVQPTFSDRPTFNGTHITFDGITEFLDSLSVMDDIQFANVGTWSVWVRFPNATTGTGTIFSLTQTTADTQCDITKNSAGKLVLTLRIAGVDQWVLETDNQVFFDNTWAHISVTHNGSTTVLRIDDVIVPQTFTTPGDQSLWINTTAFQACNIGALQTGAVTYVQFMEGDMQQLHLYDTLATPSELTQLYNYQQP